MALPAPLQALYDRLKSFYNGNAYNPTSNPGGFARGGNQQGQFIAAMRDYADFGKGVAEIGATVQADADRFEAAVAAIEAGPVTSVVGRSGIVTADHIKTAIGFDALADQLEQDVADAIAAIPVAPQIKPITMTAPTAGATNLGSGGTYTFVVQAFSGDTTGFYSDYGIPLATRFVRAYEPGGTTPVVVFTVTGSGVSFPVNFTGSGLAVSHTYEFQVGYTDAQGATVLSQRVSATTGAQFRPNLGDPLGGGFYAGDTTDTDGTWQNIVAPKSVGEFRGGATGNTNTSAGASSRTDGFGNTRKLVLQSNGGTGTLASCDNLTASSFSDWAAPAADQLKLAQDNLHPTTTAVAAFKTGGAEAFSTNGPYVSSTEASASALLGRNFTAGATTEVSPLKGDTTNVRAFRRIPG